MRSTDWIIQVVCFCTCFITVRCDFMLFVNLVNYTNPTGLCAECQIPLNSNPDGTASVCCDELPYTSSNCNNTGEARCDTRFRWTIRPFLASIEIRPEMRFAGFTDCTLSNTTCPFREMSATFSQGEGGILGVTDNPIIINSSLSTPERLQFFIEPVDSELPNIIDSLLVNLDNLQLGGDFTEEMMFTGFHNISTMTMNFRVQCSPSFCGPDCTTTPTNNPLLIQCLSNGSAVCVDSKRDPSAIALCSDCLYNLNIATNCSKCLNANYDPDTNCQTCLPNYDITADCSLCTNRRYNPADNCKSCLISSFNPLDGCISCTMEFFNPQTNCTQCLPNRNFSSGCTTCLTGFNQTCIAQCIIENNCDSGSVGSGMSTVSGILGGVVGVQFIVILILVAVIILVLCKKKKNKNNNNKQEEAERVTPTSYNEVMELQSNPLYPVHTHQPTATAHQSDQETPITMKENPVYQVTKSLGESGPNVEEQDNTAYTDYYENTETRI